VNIFNEIKKWISGIVVITFTTVSLFDFSPAIASAGAAEKEMVTGKPSLSIPSDLGSIERISKGNSQEPEVYYIQDAHDSLEAQENIAKLIQQLVKEKGIRKVYVEGYAGEDLSETLDQLYSFKDPQVKERTSHFFLDHLRLSGAQYAFVNRDTSFKLIGIENAGDYLANLKSYELASKGHKDVQRSLDEISKYLSTLADRLYPKEAQEFLKLKKRFESKQITLADYVFRLFKLADGRAQAVDHQDPGTAYPHLALVSNYLAQTQLTGEEQTELNEKLKAVDSKIFFEELDRFEEEFIRRSLQDPAALQTFRYQRQIELFGKLNALHLSAGEYQELADNRPQAAVRSLTKELAQFLAGQLKKPIVLSKDWETLIQENLHFYELAKKRDQDFKKNLRSMNGHTPVILVTGGFHTDSITNFFQEEKISYALIAPRITQDDPTHRERYDFLMSGQRYSFESSLVPRSASLPAAALQQETQPEQVVRAGMEPVARIVRAAGQIQSGEMSPKKLESLIRTEAALEASGKSLGSNSEWERHPKTFREIYEMPQEITGAKGINMADIVQEVARRMFRDRTALVVIPHGSTSYLRDRDGHILWNLVEDLDFDILILEDLGIERYNREMQNAIRRGKAKTAPSLKGQFLKELEKSLKQRGVKWERQIRLEVNIDEISDRNQFERYFNDHLPYLEEIFGTTAGLEQLRSYIEPIRRDVNLLDRYEDLWTKSKDSGVAYQKRLESLISLARIAGNMKAAEVMIDELEFSQSSRARKKPLNYWANRYRLDPAAIGEDFWKKRAAEYAGSFIGKIDFSLQEEKDISALADHLVPVDTAIKEVRETLQTIVGRYLNKGRASGSSPRLKDFREYDEALTKNFDEISAKLSTIVPGDEMVMFLKGGTPKARYEEISTQLAKSADPARGETLSKKVIDRYVRENRLLLRKVNIVLKPYHIRGASLGGTSAMTLDEASALMERELAGHLDRFPSEREDLDLARKMAEEISHYPIHKAMVVGVGLGYLPILLALMGKEVVYVDHDPYILESVQGVWETMKKAALKSGITAPLSFRAIKSEIGALELIKNGLTPHSFDLITFIDLIGGMPKGNPEDWLLKAREILRPEGYLVVDESPGADTITKYFSVIFPRYDRLAGGAYFEGSYNGPGSQNRFYKVENSSEPIDLLAQNFFSRIANIVNRQNQISYEERESRLLQTYGDFLESLLGLLEDEKPDTVFLYPFMGPDLIPALFRKTVSFNNDPRDFSERGLALIRRNFGSKAEARALQNTTNWEKGVDAVNSENYDKADLGEGPRTLILKGFRRFTQREERRDEAVKTLRHILTQTLREGDRILVLDSIDLLILREALDGLPEKEQAVFSKTTPYAQLLGSTSKVLIAAQDKNLMVPTSVLVVEKIGKAGGASLGKGLKELLNDPIASDEKFTQFRTYDFKGNGPQKAGRYQAAYKKWYESLLARQQEITASEDKELIQLWRKAKERYPYILVKTRWIWELERYYPILREELKAGHTIEGRIIATEMLSAHRDFMRTRGSDLLLQDAASVEGSLKEIIDVVAQTTPSVQAKPSIGRKKFEDLSRPETKQPEASKPPSEARPVPSAIDWRGMAAVTAGAVVLSSFLYAVLPVTLFTVSLAIILPLSLFFLFKWTWTRLLATVALSVALSIFLPIPWFGLSFALIVITQLLWQKPYPPREAPAGNQPEDKTGGEKSKSENVYEKLQKETGISSDVLQFIIQLNALLYPGLVQKNPNLKDINTQFILDTLFRLTPLEPIPANAESLDKDLYGFVMKKLNAWEGGFTEEEIRKSAAILRDWPNVSNPELAEALLTITGILIKELDFTEMSERNLSIVLEAIRSYFRIDRERFEQVRFLMLLIRSREEIESNKWKGTSAQRYYEQGRIEFYFKDYKQAEEAFQNAARSEPGNADYLFALGVLKHYQKDWKSAGEFYGASLHHRNPAADPVGTEKLKIGLAKLLIEKTKKQLPIESEPPGPQTGREIKGASLGKSQMEQAVQTIEDDLRAIEDNLRPIARDILARKYDRINPPTLDDLVDAMPEIDESFREIYELLPHVLVPDYGIEFARERVEITRYERIAGRLKENADTDRGFALQKKAIEYYVKANRALARKIRRLLRYYRLDLKKIGPPMSWSTEADGIKNVKAAIQNYSPRAWKFYQDFDTYSDPEYLEEARAEFYSITDFYFDLWGLKDALDVSKAPYFQGSYITALQRSFPLLQLKDAEFRGASLGKQEVDNNIRKIKSALALVRINLGSIEAQGRNEKYNRTNPLSLNDVVPYMAEIDKGFTEAYDILPHVLIADYAADFLPPADGSQKYKKISIWFRGKASGPEKGFAIEKSAVRDYLKEVRALAVEIEDLAQNYRIDLPQVGPVLSWESEADGVKNVQAAIQQQSPRAWAFYRDLSATTDPKFIEEGKTEFYTMTEFYFDLWGLKDALDVSKAPYFQGSYITALQKSFPRLQLENAKFRGASLGRAERTFLLLAHGGYELLHLAAQFRSRIYVLKQGPAGRSARVEVKKEKDIAILGLGSTDEITLIAEGPDAEDAVNLIYEELKDRDLADDSNTVEPDMSREGLELYAQSVRHSRSTEELQRKMLKLEVLRQEGPELFKETLAGLKKEDRDLLSEELKWVLANRGPPPYPVPPVDSLKTPEDHRSAKQRDKIREYQAADIARVRWQAHIETIWYPEPMYPNITEVKRSLSSGRLVPVLGEPIAGKDWMDSRMPLMLAKQGSEIDPPYRTLTPETRDLLYQFVTYLRRWTHQWKPLLETERLVLTSLTRDAVKQEALNQNEGVTASLKSTHGTGNAFDIWLDYFRNPSESELARYPEADRAAVQKRLKAHYEALTQTLIQWKNEGRINLIWEYEGKVAHVARNPFYTRASSLGREWGDALKTLKIKDDLGASRIYGESVSNWFYRRPEVENFILNKFFPSQPQAFDPGIQQERRQIYDSWIRANLGDLKTFIIDRYEKNMGAKATEQVKLDLDKITSRHLELARASYLQKRGRARRVQPLLPKDEEETKQANRLKQLIFLAINSSDVRAKKDAGDLRVEKLRKMRLWDLPIWPITEFGNINTDLMKSWIRTKTILPPAEWYTSDLKSLAQIAGSKDPIPEPKEPSLFDGLAEGQSLGQNGEADKLLVLEHIRRDLREYLDLVEMDFIVSKRGFENPGIGKVNLVTDEATVSRNFEVLSSFFQRTVPGDEVADFLTGGSILKRYGILAEALVKSPFSEKSVQKYLEGTRGLLDQVDLLLKPYESGGIQAKGESLGRAKGVTPSRGTGIDPAIYRILEILKVLEKKAASDSYDPTVSSEREDLQNFKTKIRNDIDIIAKTLPHAVPGDEMADFLAQGPVLDRYAAAVGNLYKGTGRKLDFAPTRESVQTYLKDTRTLVESISEIREESRARAAIQKSIPEDLEEQVAEFDVTLERIRIELQKIEDYFIETTYETGRRAEVEDVIEHEGRVSDDFDELADTMTQIIPRQGKHSAEEIGRLLSDYRVISDRLIDSAYKTKRRQLTKRALRQYIKDSRTLLRRAKSLVNPYTTRGKSLGGEDALRPTLKPILDATGDLAAKMKDIGLPTDLKERIEKISEIYREFYETDPRSPRWSVPEKSPFYYKAKMTTEGVFEPSNIWDIAEIFHRIGLKSGDTLLDLGSGDGRVLAIASLFGAIATGYEADPELAGVANDMLKKMSERGLIDPSRIHLKEGNFLEEDFSRFHYIFYYDLGSRSLSEIAGKTIEELKPDARLLVYRLVDAADPRFRHLDRLRTIPLIPLAGADNQNRTLTVFDNGTYLDLEKRSSLGASLGRDSEKRDLDPKTAAIERKANEIYNSLLQIQENYLGSKYNPAHPATVSNLKPIESVIWYNFNKISQELSRIVPGDEMVDFLTNGTVNDQYEAIASQLRDSVQKDEERTIPEEALKDYVEGVKALSGGVLYFVRSNHAEGKSLGAEEGSISREKAAAILNSIQIPKLLFMDFDDYEKLSPEQAGELLFFAVRKAVKIIIYNDQESKLASLAPELSGLKTVISFRGDETAAYEIYGKSAKEKILHLSKTADARSKLAAEKFYFFREPAQAKGTLAAAILYQSLDGKLPGVKVENGFLILDLEASLAKIVQEYEARFELATAA